ncbi:maleylpyruvate isomerase family mycothiol-dependent enzyme [Streptomyces meridianus]|uniref:Maleylpyruvate isomerase family mycothiol-dependent enzyme n=1 Tax=Streptomyces meridianus TaxID=2938945 RepID=A0ABT0X357_9ACTN|nr:maleylpyruvate isomerase family mycothiol-dependent enzyme [Streptomyces meridianus]MCM2576884.1 maleylpyruvate isomerase family mycothiol-dependent enzyme [Streptomyces meridianus]
MTTPQFTDLLTLIEERSAALRAAAAGADLDLRVPGCPEWTLGDLITHITQVQRFWAAVVASGPSDRRPDTGPAAQREPESGAEEATALLVDALRTAGPEAGCWTWWGKPATAGAVARHQVQEAAVHARDAQETVGRTEPLPAGIAADAISEFIEVWLGSLGPWPYAPARLALYAGEGTSWLLDLGPDGAALLTPEDGALAAADARVHGSASDLLLALYGRVPAGSLRTEGDPEQVKRLLSWPTAD